MRVVFAAHSHGCISHTGDIPHWKGSAKGTAQHGAGMQCHRIPVRVSLVNADPVLLARPHSIPLLYHFHRSTADSQRRFQAARKRPCLQHDGTCVSADVEAASAFYYTVRAADRSGLSILFEAIAPHPAAAPYWLGSQSARLWYFTADLRTRLIVMQPNNQKMRYTTIAQCGMAHFLCNYSQSCFFGSPNRRIIWILHQPDLIRVGPKHDDGI